MLNKVPSLSFDKYSLLCHNRTKNQYVRHLRAIIYETNPVFLCIIPVFFGLIMFISVFEVEWHGKGQQYAFFSEPTERANCLLNCIQLHVVNK